MPVKLTYGDRAVLPMKFEGALHVPEGGGLESSRSPLDVFEGDPRCQALVSPGAEVSLASDGARVVARGQGSTLEFFHATGSLRWRRDGWIERALRHRGPGDAPPECDALAIACAFVGERNLLPSEAGVTTTAQSPRESSLTVKRIARDRAESSRVAARQFTWTFRYHGVSLRDPGAKVQVTVDAQGEVVEWLHFWHPLDGVNPSATPPSVVDDLPGRVQAAFERALDDGRGLESTASPLDVTVDEADATYFLASPRVRQARIPFTILLAGTLPHRASGQPLAFTRYLRAVGDELQLVDADAVLHP